MDKLEAIKNKLREMDKECKGYKPCNDCSYKNECDEISDEYPPTEILNVLEIIEKLLND